MAFEERDSARGRPDRSGNPRTCTPGGGTRRSATSPWSRAAERGGQARCLSDQSRVGVEEEELDDSRRHGGSANAASPARRTRSVRLGRARRGCRAFRPCTTPASLEPAKAVGPDCRGRRSGSRCSRCRRASRERRRGASPPTCGRRRPFLPAAADPEVTDCEDPRRLARLRAQRERGRRRSLQGEGRPTADRCSMPLPLRQARPHDRVLRSFQRGGRQTLSEPAHGRDAHSRSSGRLMVTQADVKEVEHERRRIARDSMQP